MGFCVGLHSTLLHVCVRAVFSCEMFNDWVVCSGNDRSSVAYVKRIGPNEISSAHYLLLSFELCKYVHEVV